MSTFLCKITMQLCGLILKIMELVLNPTKIQPGLVYKVCTNALWHWVDSFISKVLLVRGAALVSHCQLGEVYDSFVVGR